MANNHERRLRLRRAMEREGLGPSVWGERDCISLVRAVIREMSGSEPVLALPGWTDGLDEQEAILRAPREHGSLRAVLIGMLEAEPLLKRVEKRVLPAPGMIGLTPAKGFHVERCEDPAHGPFLGVVGPDCALWLRTHDRLRRAHPIAELWEIVA